MPSSSWNPRNKSGIYLACNIRAGGNFTNSQGGLNRPAPSHGGPVPVGLTDNKAQTVPNFGGTVGNWAFAPVK
ncbi:MAG TPA: hypothetical protein DCZ07_04435 [Alphaproteobacteria bacterium]|jgi:hypothetical protein|nr:hypothetical protein [Alphaproteobacteria bacterium]HBA42202.1 hypothetical protein [Alphaproteobacteria bacterium]